MSDNKIIALEEKIAHIQHMLDDLNMVVFRQGETIENLNNQIKELKEKMENLKSLNPVKKSSMMTNLPTTS